MKKRILLSAGGTATTWSLIRTIKKYYRENFIVHVCDINPPYLIAASKFADKFHIVPLCSAKHYYDYMMDLMNKNKIEYFVPLINEDLKFFHSDNKDLINLGIKSSGPRLSETKFLDKKIMYNHLMNNYVPVPKLFNIQNILHEDFYFIKPRNGFGSKDCKIEKGKNIKYNKDCLIQEILNKPEFTLDVYFDENGIKMICRERIETKAGVSVKARFLQVEELFQISQKISQCINLPLVSCIQFMKNRNNQWCVSDLNFRFGAGSSMSSKVGFNIYRAFIEKFVFDNDPSRFLKVPKEERYVIRVYQDILI